MTTAPEPLCSGVDFAHDLARHGARPALRTETGVLTYADIAERVDTAATDLGPDPRLVTLRPAPTVEFVVGYLAALAAGHPTLLTDNPALATAYHAEVGREGDAWRTTGATSPGLHPDLQLLLSTSGSTGSPKLVRLSAANVGANAAAIADYLGLSADDVAITTLRLDYCYGLSVLHSHLAVGASVVLTDRSVTDPELWRLARRVGVTSFAGVPYTFDLLASTGWPDVPTLRQVTQAGGRLAPDRVRDLAARGRREGWDLVVMYGQTEATARMSYLPPALAETHPAAIGVPIPGGELRVDQPGPDGSGELVYRGRNVMMGYAEGPADLARGPELEELRTGDLARVNDAGLFEITGRCNRIAKVFGQRIDLDRVSTLLTAEGYDVSCAEAADDSEQVVVALAGTPDPISVELVLSAAVDATRLPRHALRVVPVAEIPRRGNGKPDHAAVAALETAHTGSAPSGRLDAIRAQYATVLGREVGPDDTFAGLGGDSLSYVELAVRLEGALGKLPRDWPTTPVAELAGLDRAAPRRLWQWLDTTIALRALAIVLIVGSHSDLFAVTGGAHVLLAVAGFNLARFVVTGADPGQRRRGLARAVARIAVPAVIWIGAVSVIADAYGWRNVLLLNDVLGPREWAEPAFYFWFVEVLVYFVLGTAALLSVPALGRWERRTPFWFAVALLAIALAPRWWASATGYDGDVIHSSLFVAWFFVAGWAAARATTAGQRALVTAIVLVGLHGYFDDLARGAVVAAGVVVLTWLPAVPWPRALSGAAGIVASASLYVYLTHWQVYPHLKHEWPLGGLLASLAVGIAAWWIAERATAVVRRRRDGPARTG